MIKVRPRRVATGKDAKIKQTRNLLDDIFRHHHTWVFNLRGAC